MVYQDFSMIKTIGNNGRFLDILGKVISVVTCTSGSQGVVPRLEPAPSTGNLFSSVQFISAAQSCPTLCDPMNHSTPGLPVHQQLPEFTQTHVHWVGDAIRPSHPLLSPSPPAFNFSQHQSLFQWVNSSHEVAKVLDFSCNIIPSKERPGLISLRMDWLDLLAVQGTLKSLLQHHSSKESIIWFSVFLMVHLSHPYMTTEESIALTRWTFVGKVMSLLFEYAI